MLFVSIAIALSQSATAATQGQVPVPQPSSEMSATAPSVLQPGKIIMYRGSSVFGAGVACPIRYKGQEVVELACGKFAGWSVAAGRYILTNHTSSVEVAVNPGETRYVRCMIKMGVLAGRADLQIVDRESFNEHKNEFEQKAVELTATPIK